MKIKELQKVVNIAWSPLPQYPIYLAAGTAAQQFDSNANSILEIYSTNFSDPSYDLELKASLNSKYKFHKVIWSPTGFGGVHRNGLIVGGCEGGLVMVYSAEKLLMQEDSLLACQDKHSGPVTGLDFNPFQMNLLASCASESEIFIWDLNNTSTHMNPGTKTQPLEDVKNVAWNRQVQHILASVFSSRCVIWDLRKSEQIIKLSDTQSRVRWHAIQWHPDMATQIWLASEDDQSPVIQLWDLRYATAPARTVQIHQRGVLGMSWCSRDSDLMVSCGKDNRIYCWNPNSEQPNSEILSEVAITASWYSDVQWCPRNPALIASSSFDGNVSIYSLFGGTQQKVQTSKKIADSFPGMDGFAQVPVNQSSAPVVYKDLKYAPKWLKQTTGAAFSFGGKLVSFNSMNKIIKVNQVTTEPLLVERAQILEKTLGEMNFIEYCRQKGDQMIDQNGRYMWYFIKANFERDPKEEILNLLGFNKGDIDEKFVKYINEEETNKEQTPDVEQLTNRLAHLDHSNSTDFECDQSSDVSPIGEDIHLCDGTTSNATLKQIDDKITKELSTHFKIPRNGDNVSLITEAIITDNIEAAVKLCLNTGRIPEALILASTAGIDFLTKIQSHYLKEQQKKENDLSNIISAVVTRDWMHFITHCDVDSWKEVLVAVLRHNERKVVNICEKLGDRLLTERSQNIDYIRNAILCFICAGNLDKLIACWRQLKQLKHGNPTYILNTEELQELAEIIMLMNKSLEQQGVEIELTNTMVEFISEYAGILVAQGAFTTALTYLTEIKACDMHPELSDLRQRISNILQPEVTPIRTFQIEQHHQHNQQQQNQNSKENIAFQQKGQQKEQQAQPKNSFPPTTTIPSSSLYPVPTHNNNNQYPVTSPINQYNLPVNASGGSRPPPLLMTPNNNLINVPTNIMGMQPSHSQQQHQQSLPPPPMKSPFNENVQQPSRPPSTASSQDSITKPHSALHTRSKYLLDPSVAGSNALINPYTNVYSTQLPQMNSTINQYNMAPISNNNNYMNNNNNNTTSNNVMPIMTTAVTDTPNMMPISQQPMPAYSTAGYMPGAAPNVETATSQQILSCNFQNIQRNPTPPPGWNDPPSIQSSKQVKKVEPIQAFAAPITHPLFGVDPNQNECKDVTYIQNQQNISGGMAVLPPSSLSLTQSGYARSGAIPFNKGANVKNYQQQQQKQNLVQQMYNKVNDQYQQQQLQQQPQYEDQEQRTNEVRTTQKPPLPEEYIYLQTVLEELKTQCLNKATDPRTKRKFVDVTKRLETLYDCLRDKRLSSSTTQSLNQIVQFLQVGDYNNALQCHTQIVFGSDFSQCAGFMPGLKVLIQSANELHVFLQ